MNAKILAMIILVACVAVGCRSNAARRHDAGSTRKTSYASKLFTSLFRQQFEEERKPPYDGPRKWHWDDESQRKLKKSMSDRERESERAKHQVDNQASLDRALSNLELR